MTLQTELSLHVEKWEKKRQYISAAYCVCPQPRPTHWATIQIMSSPLAGLVINLRYCRPAPTSVHITHKGPHSTLHREPINQRTRRPGSLNHRRQPGLTQLLVTPSHPSPDNHVHTHSYLTQPFMEITQIPQPFSLSVTLGHQARIKKLPSSKK